jgi:ribosomal protein L40E
MELVHCSFCKHGNPADAKFCNACGSSLALQLCQACGAIDNISATACHKCGQPFARSVHVVAPDAGEAQSVTPQAQAEQPVRAGRSPWKLFALLALVVAGALVIYPRVAGDEAGLSALPAPAEVADEPAPSLPAPDPPPAVTAEPAPSGTAHDADEAAQPPADAATDSVADAPAHSSEAGHEGAVETPSSTDTTPESAAEEASAPTTTAQSAESQSAEVPDSATATPQATPAGCSPAIDALGLCPQGFR